VDTPVQQKREKCVLLAANRRLVPRVSILYSTHYVDVAREENRIKGKIPQGGRNVLRTCWMSRALDCTLYSTRCGRGYGSVARQYADSAVKVWMPKCIINTQSGCRKKTPDLSLAHC
jgi:hypothetical protein